jgi:hypothetical protein
MELAAELLDLGDAALEDKVSIIQLAHGDLTGNEGQHRPFLMDANRFGESYSFGILSFTFVPSNNKTITTKIAAVSGINCITLPLLLDRVKKEMTIQRIAKIAMISQAANLTFDKFFRNAMISNAMPKTRFSMPMMCHT